MLTKQTYQFTNGHIIVKTAQLLPWQVKEKNQIADNILDFDFRWQSDPERFNLVANETIKVGSPVNRNDADYWISQFARLGAIGEGERVGRVKVAEVAQ